MSGYSEESWEEWRESLVPIGGPVDRISISLRVFGADLDPDHLSSRMGCVPSQAWRKGAAVPPNGRKTRAASTGAWILSVADVGGDEFEAALDGLLDGLPQETGFWEELTHVYYVDFFCGLFLDAFNRGLRVSPLLLKRLADRNLELNFDIYSAPDDTD